MAQRNDEIDFRIVGEDMQFVEVELDPGESAVAEAGTMMYKDAAVRMETVFGDGSSPASGGGFFDKLVGAGKRLVTGESLFTTVFTHGGTGKARVAFAAPYPGTIVPMLLSDFGGRIICQKDAFLCAARGVSIGLYFQKKVMTALFGGEGFIMQKLEGDGLVFVHAGGTIVPMTLTNYGGRIICQKDSFLCAARGVSIGLFFQKKVMTALFGGEGFIMQKLEGDGLVFVHAGGTIVERELAAGERLDVDTGCVVAMTAGVDFDIKSVGSVKSMLFGGEGVFLATLTGPGKVWIQSLPFSRLAGRMMSAAGGGRDEGSVLGGIGKILGGDNSF